MQNFASCTQLCGRLSARTARFSYAATAWARVPAAPEGSGRGARSADDAALVDARVAEPYVSEPLRPRAVVREVALVDERERGLDGDLVRTELGDRERQEPARTVAAHELEPDEPLAVLVDERGDRPPELDAVHPHGEGEDARDGE